jgi:hypothetical protein
MEPLPELLVSRIEHIFRAGTRFFKSCQPPPCVISYRGGIINKAAIR